MALAVQPPPGPAPSDANVSGRFGFDITPSDTVDLPFVTRALDIGVGGDIKVTMVGTGTGTGNAADGTGNGGVITYLNRVSGQVYSYAVTRVWETGTNATNIKGVY